MSDQGNVLYDVIFYATENLPVIFRKSVWETFFEGSPQKDRERPTKFLPTGEPDFSKNKLSTVYLQGFPGVSGLQNPVIYFPY